MEYSWGGKCSGTISNGCKMCIEGQKTVVFITGHCKLDCYYCPVSIKKMHQDNIYVNEMFIKSNTPINKVIKLIIEEVTLSNSWGISITGGDPLLYPERCFNISSALKKKYGPKFHIHLYTQGREGNSKIFAKLSKVIDEIRFHPKNLIDLEKLKQALNNKYIWNVGIEYPAIPKIGKSKWFRKIIDTYCTYSQKSNRKNLFLNLNELEYSETNFRRMINAGFSPIDKNVIKYVVSQSKEEAFWIIENFSIDFPDLNVFYCPAAQKDTQQLPNRLWRRANKIKFPHDIILEEPIHRGLLLRGIIKIKDFSEDEILLQTLELEELRIKLIEKFSIPEKMITVDYQKQQLLTNAIFLEDFSEKIKIIFPNIIIGVVEEYPTIDRLQTSYIPL